MDHDYMARGYLLPAGCKDLIDALHLRAIQDSPLCAGQLANFLNLKSKLSPEQFDCLYQEIRKKLKPQFLKFDVKKPSTQPAPVSPAMLRQIVIPAETSVAQLALLLEQPVPQIVADVLALGFFVTVQETLSFEIISSIARKHGFFAIRAAA